jgi:hypothetical protein
VIAKLIFKFLLKKFSRGDRADIFYYQSPCGEFFFFRDNGWPEKIEGCVFNPKPSATFLSIVIAGKKSSSPAIDFHDDIFEVK